MGGGVVSGEFPDAEEAALGGGGPGDGRAATPGTLCRRCSGRVCSPGPPVITAGAKAQPDRAHRSTPRAQCTPLGLGPRRGERLDPAEGRGLRAAPAGPGPREPCPICSDTVPTQPPFARLFWVTKGKSEEATQFSPPALSQSFCASSSQALSGLRLHLLPESFLRFIPTRWVPQSRCGRTSTAHRGLGPRDLFQRWLPAVVLVQAGLSSRLHGLCVCPLARLLSSAAFSAAQERPWPLFPWGNQDPCPDRALRKSM